MLLNWQNANFFLKVCLSTPGVSSTQGMIDTFVCIGLSHLGSTDRLIVRTVRNLTSRKRRHAVAVASFQTLMSLYHCNGHTYHDVFYFSLIKSTESESKQEVSEGFTNCPVKHMDHPRFLRRNQTLSEGRTLSQRSVSEARTISCLGQYNLGSAVAFTHAVTKDIAEMLLYKVIVYKN